MASSSRRNLRSHSLTTLERGGDIEGGHQGKQMPMPRATPGMADKGEPATTECNTDQLLATMATSVLALQTSI